MISPSSLPSPAGYSFGSYGPMTQLEGDHHRPHSAPSPCINPADDISLAPPSSSPSSQDQQQQQQSHASAAAPASPMILPSSSASSSSSSSSSAANSSPTMAPSTTFQKSAPAASLSVALCRSVVLKYIYLTYLFLLQILVWPLTVLQRLFYRRKTSRINSNSNSSGNIAGGRGIEGALVSTVGEKFLHQYTLDNQLGHSHGDKGADNNNNISNNSNNGNIISSSSSGSSSGNSNNNNNSNNGNSMLRRSSRFKSRSDLEEIAQASTTSLSGTGSQRPISSRPSPLSLGYGTDSMAEDYSGDNSATARGMVRMRQRMGRPMSGLGLGSHGVGGKNARKKTLVLDLDETLIHSTSRGSRSQGYMVEVLVDRHACLYYVYKRPHVDYFLKKVSEWYKLVIFTASMAEYADPVIDWLDQNRTLFDKRYFRQACFFRNGSYLKDLTVIDPDLSSVCLLDNSPISYSLNKENGIPIDSWIDDPNDEALLDLLPFLDALRFTEDVRSILSLRTI